MTTDTAKLLDEIDVALESGGLSPWASDQIRGIAARLKQTDTLSDEQRQGLADLIAHRIDARQPERPPRGPARFTRSVGLEDWHQ